MTPASSPARPARPPEDWVAVGVIRGAFGVHGALKVEPYTDVQSSVLAFTTGVVPIRRTFQSYDWGVCVVNRQRAVRARGSLILRARTRRVNSARYG